MPLFSRTPQHPPVALADHWRGRARDLEDVSGLPWQVMMAVLQTEDGARAAATGEPFAALGLECGDLGPRWADAFRGVRLSGVRHGRQVEIRIGLRERNWGMAAVMVTWVRAGAPDPHLDGDRGGAIHPRLAPDAGLWSGVRVRGGAEGLVARRKMSCRTHSQGYLYDLWLLERLADVYEGVALPVEDVSQASIPYGLG